VILDFFFGIREGALADDESALTQLDNERGGRFAHGDDDYTRFTCHEASLERGWLSVTG